MGDISAENYSLRSKFFASADILAKLGGCCLWTSLCIFILDAIISFLGLVGGELSIGGSYFELG
jgi:hypothetical protein